MFEQVAILLKNRPYLVRHRKGDMLPFGIQQHRPHVLYPLIRALLATGGAIAMVATKEDPRGVIATGVTTAIGGITHYR
jgi:hypothetical protein